MAETSIVIIGLPESGKTTYLAALWHQITAGDVETKLRFRNLLAGNSKHLNSIAARWRNAIVQERTALTGNRRVSMNLFDTADQAVCVTFPDVPGETYRGMWENRVCDSEIADILRNGNVLLFIHADTIQAPKWTVDEVAISAEAGVEKPDGPVEAWKPVHAPTQVQLVDLLQLLRLPPLDAGPRFLAVMLSAWDKAHEEGLEPESYFETKLPLLSQYLCSGGDDWNWRVYGLSAQGGEYDTGESDGQRVCEAEELRNLDRPSERIKLVGPKGDSHDLTAPLAWLMS